MSELRVLCAELECQHFGTLEVELIGVNGGANLGYGADPKVQVLVNDYSPCI